MKHYLTFFILLLAMSSIAQDRIVKKDGKVIEADVKEVGLNEVKYLEWETDGPILSIGVDMLQRVELRTGRVIEFKDPLTDPESYTDQKKSAVKLEFLSPLMEHLQFTFERSIRPGRSFETKLGLIGVGFDTYDDEKSSGIHLGVGYKFIKTPDFYAQRMKYAHILKGSYVKPEVLLSIYRNEYDRYISSSGNMATMEDDVVSGALVLNLGKQVVYDDSFLIDYSIGVGYGFTSQKFEDEFYNTGRENQYGFFLTSDDVPLVLKFSLKIGLMF